jgi:RHS repeat-associated protein
VGVRYQLSNHLGSATFELDDAAVIISYEEFHPFGSTSYRSGRNAAKTSLKRYRYVVKERDDETGLYYYGARYYAAWLARFVSVDPLKDDYPYYTSYQYAGNKPVTFIDLDGLEEATPPLLLTPALRQIQRSAFSGKSTTSSEKLAKSDNTQNKSLDKKIGLIQSDVDKKQNLEQFKVNLSNNKTSFQTAPIKETVKASSTQHPGVGTDLQKLAESPVIRGVSVGLMGGVAQTSIAESSVASTFVKDFAFDIMTQAVSKGLDNLQETGSFTVSLNDIDLANAMTSAVFKSGKIKNIPIKDIPGNQILEEAIKTIFDSTINDPTKTKDLLEDQNKILSEFGLRLGFKAIPGSFKDQFRETTTSQLGQFTIEVLKKSSRNELNEINLENTKSEHSR